MCSKHYTLSQTCLECGCFALVCGDVAPAHCKVVETRSPAIRNVVRLFPRRRKSRKKFRSVDALRVRDADCDRLRTDKTRTYNGDLLSSTRTRRGHAEKRGAKYFQIFCDVLLPRVNFQFPTFPCPRQKKKKKKNSVPIPNASSADGTGAICGTRQLGGHGPKQISVSMTRKCTLSLRGLRDLPGDLLFGTAYTASHLRG